MTSRLTRDFDDKDDCDLPRTSTASTPLLCGCVHTMTVTMSQPIAFHLDIQSCFAHANAEAMVELLDEVLSPGRCVKAGVVCLSHGFRLPCPNETWRKMKEGRK